MYFHIYLRRPMIPKKIARNLFYFLLLPVSVRPLLKPIYDHNYYSYDPYHSIYSSI